MANSDVAMTLRQAVDEVMGLLTGLDVQYDPNLDRFNVVVRCLNRALRAVALEHEWSYFSSTEEAGVAVQGQSDVELPPRLRPRIVNDDAVRLVNANGATLRWAYILPRDAVHKYRARSGLWCSVTRTTITFSRPFNQYEAGLRVMVPVMREPKQFKPADGTLTEAILNQLVDFDYPDLVTARAAYLYAQTDPVMQPRVQTLEAQYKDIMYQLIERDERHTDSAYVNEWIVPIEGELHGSSYNDFAHAHPHSDERWR